MLAEEKKEPGPDDAKVVAIDLQAMAPLKGVIQLQVQYSTHPRVCVLSPLLAVLSETENTCTFLSFSQCCMW